MKSEDLISKWQNTFNKSSHIFTWTEPHCLGYICEHASRATAAAEVGVYMGKVSKVIMDAGAGHLWTIDPFMVAGTRNVTEYFLREEIRQGRCEVIPKHTREAAAMLQHMKGKMDFVFIDDGHAYEDVITDITCFLPMVRPGGIICGHDYETAPENDVARAVKQLLPGHTEPVPRLWSYTVPV